ncbi:MAG TPA: TylF/MycF/NovP-related O-methyltransferase [Caulobacteraceae bacterium]|nr:TylF/MycF/NovP-related O-methyltransferase [Caulobacteraceae bacterium]
MVISGALTREDVTAAYRAILGREPESEAAIEAHMGHRTAAQLINALFESLEATELRRQRHRATTEDWKSYFSTAVSAGGRDLYLDLMARVLTNMIYGDPSNNPENAGEYRAELRATGQDWPVTAHTMAGLKRLNSLRSLCQQAIDDGVPGHFAETGIWRGGCCIMMRAVLAAHGIDDRSVYAFDSFEGLPPPNPTAYPDDEGLALNEYDQFAVGLEQVRDNFQRYGLLDRQVEFVKGYFEETLPAFEGGPFALIRLDGDLYESTHLALKHLYPKLSPGGFVVIDDYGCIPQCAKAVDDFRSEHGLDQPIHWVDWTGVWWRKPF